MEPNIERIEELVRELLAELGEDPDREGLVDTPLRVAKSLAFLTHGYRLPLEQAINNAVFTQDTSSMVIVKDIEVYSLCEHHMLPFFGRCHIGYIPNGKVFGVSKLAIGVYELSQTNDRESYLMPLMAAGALINSHTPPHTNICERD
jgi:GTP cyclohydrolase IA